MSRFMPRGFIAEPHKVGDDLFGKILTAEDIAALNPKPIIEPKPAAHEFTPQQQMGMLYLRGSELSKAVYAKLSHSTARASAATYVELTGMRYAEPQRNKPHRLTYIGWVKANNLAIELAQQFGFTVPRADRFDLPRGNSTGYGDSWFR